MSAHSKGEKVWKRKEVCKEKTISLWVGLKGDIVDRYEIFTQIDLCTWKQVKVWYPYI
jgi:hypothetical protein